MAGFAENLARLPNVNADRLHLLDATGRLLTTIENKPGTQGSFRIYAYVARKWSGITPEAAAEALELFAEHVDDARRNPGKHPNIDRLILLIQENGYLSCTFD